MNRRRRLSMRLRRWKIAFAKWRIISSSKSSKIMLIFIERDEDGLTLKRACVWAVHTVHVLVQRTCEVLASARVPDLVLSYVFTHHVEENISSIRPPRTSGVDVLPVVQGYSAFPQRSYSHARPHFHRASLLAHAYRHAPAAIP
jgi:hypothetical protein